MDILAARKKAAEQASARNKPDQETVAPATEPKQEQEAPPASAVPDVAPPAMVEDALRIKSVQFRGNSQYR